MKFLVDESTGLKVAEFLRKNGHDVLFVTEAMPQSDDQTILAKAKQDKRILVTNDKDFGELVFRSGEVSHGVILFRLSDERAANRVRVIKTVLQKYASRLANHFSVATETEIRIRPILKL